ncbi:MAG: hypothetical protein RI910_2959 [Verrucomicrobiota bacterium]
MFLRLALTLEVKEEASTWILSLSSRLKTVGAHVEHHERPEAAALRGPAGAEGVASPGGGRSGEGAAKGDEADAAVRQVSEGRAFLDFVRDVFLAIEDDDLVLAVLHVDDLARPVGFGHHGAGALEFFDQGFDGDMVVGDDRHLEGGGAKGDGREGQDEAQEGADAGKHGFIKRSPPEPTRLSYKT